MKNSKNPEKKSNFKLDNILLYMCIIFIIWSYFTTENIKNEYDSERSHIINTYQSKIDSINDINILLIEKQDSINYKLDSLNKVKKIIINNYDKKINYIKDASAVDHAKWMDSIVSELRNK